MFSFLRSKKQPLIFAPHLAIFENNDHYTIRAEGGDEANSIKTFKVDATNISSMELEFEGFNEYESSTKSSDCLFVSGKTILTINRHSGESSKLLLAEQRLPVHGISTKVKGRKTPELKFPPTEEISKLIKDTWKEEFSYCLDDLYQPEQPQQKNKSSKADKAITTFCIIVVFLAAIFGIAKFMNKDVNAKLQTNNTLINEMVDSQANNNAPLQTTPEHDQVQLQKEVEKETLAEFGLSSGISLD